MKPDVPAQAPEAPDCALSYLEILDEEYWQLMNVPPAAGSEQLRAAYRKEGRFEAACAEETEAGRAYREDVIRRLHAAERKALCFSGGGIRSATFGLGILEGLAIFSRKTDALRPQLLGEFDYLSTVSGGGYLGAWFSAWATRLSKIPDLSTKPVRGEAKAPGWSIEARWRNLKAWYLTRFRPQPGPAKGPEAEGDVPLKRAGIPDLRDGAGLVMHDLSQPPQRSFAPERSPIQYLRAYSNYLSPRLGFLSSDSWMLVATVMRNMLLNWMVLLPAVAAALLLPVICSQILTLTPDFVDADTLWQFLITGFLLGAFATAYVGFDLPNAGNARRPPLRFAIFCLAPLGISALALISFWAWLPDLGKPMGWWDVIGYGKSGIVWWHFGLFGAALHGGGMLAGFACSRVVFRRPPTRTGVVASLAAFAAGFVGGIAVWIAAHFATTKPHTNGDLLHPTLYACIAFPILMGIFWLTSILLVGATSYVTEDEDREWWARSGGWILAIALGWLSFAFLTLYASAALQWFDLRFTASFSTLTGLTGFAAAKTGSSAGTPSGRRETEGNSAGSPVPAKVLQRYAGKLLVPLFLIMAAMLLAALNSRILQWFGDTSAADTAFGVTRYVLALMLIYAVICAVASWFINVNKFSLHAMYRQRLIRAYLGASNEFRDPHPFTGFDENDNMAMCALTANRPMHVVNMALNLVHGSNLAWQERKAASYTSTRLHTGGLCVGYRSSNSYGGRYKEGETKTPISLGTAMTISGAAASPNMGYHSSPLLTVIMTLFNARLGWWLGNPKCSNQVWGRPGPRWGIRAFFDEAFGLTTDTNSWVYLSDGGHFENLGIYEMVLRRCRYIVVSDAGCDPAFTYEDLANAIRKIRIDLGIPIEFDDPQMPMSPEQRPTAVFSGKHCAIGRILYNRVDGELAPEGTLVYIKPSLNGNEPADVQHYAAAHRPFPHQATSDQFFTESQFESYRQLGLHIVEEMLKPDGRFHHYDLQQFVTAARMYSHAIQDEDES